MRCLVYSKERDEFNDSLNFQYTRVARIDDKPFVQTIPLVDLYTLQIWMALAWHMGMVERTMEIHIQYSL